MYRIVKLAILGIMCLAVAGCDGTTEENQEATEPQYMPNDVPVATLFYPSHGFQQAYPHEATGGRGTTGWNVYGPTGSADPFPWTGFTTTWPEIGWYASGDMETIEWQVEQMQRAGIDTVIISWYGWGDTKLDGAPVDPKGLFARYQEATTMMLDYIKANRVPMKFALLVEAFTYFVGDDGISTAALTDAQRQMVADYAWDNFYAPTAYGDFALHLEGRPVVFGGPDEPGGWWKRHNWTDDRFTLIEGVASKNHEAEYTANYVYLDPPAAIPGVHGIVNIWPRFTSVITYASNSPYFPWYNPPVGGNPDRPVNLPEVDPFGTEGKYDDAWRRIIEHRQRSEIKMVWIWYWNSYWEVCYIEPDAGIGAYAVDDLYVRKTAHYTDLFRKGLPFERYDDPDELSR